MQVRALSSEYERRMGWGAGPLLCASTFVPPLPHSPPRTARGCGCFPAGTGPPRSQVSRRAGKVSPFPFVFTPSCPDRDTSLNVCAPGHEATEALPRQEATQSLLPRNPILPKAGPYSSWPLHEHCLLVFGQLGGSGVLWAVTWGRQVYTPESCLCTAWKGSVMWRTVHGLWTHRAGFESSLEQTPWALRA